MYLQNRITGQMELQDTDFDADAVSEAWRIEHWLNRAHEIHRAHGGCLVTTSKIGWRRNGNWSREIDQTISD